MKKVIGGKVYDTETMRRLCDKSAYNNGNYSGSTWIGQTSGGNYAVVTTSNGQDLYRESNITAITRGEIPEHIDGWELSDEEIANLGDVLTPA
jgi:hypothetical protein